jgi:hypothetical protein
MQKKQKKKFNIELYSMNKFIMLSLSSLSVTKIDKKLLITPYTDITGNKNKFAKSVKRFVNVPVEL